MRHLLAKMPILRITLDMKKDGKMDLSKIRCNLLHFVLLNITNSKELLTEIEFKRGIQKTSIRHRENIYCNSATYISNVD